MGAQFSQMYPPTSKFIPERDIQDLMGKVVLVTGGNTGIGKETCRVLLLKNAKVWLAARSESKAQLTIDELKQTTGKDDIHFLQLDLGSVISVKKSAETFISQNKVLDILINNAGVLLPPPGSKTSDGFELQWGTNLLGHFVLTKTLLPLLISTASQRPKGSVRVVNVSASGHAFAPEVGIDFSTLRNGTRNGFKNAMEDSGQGKLGIILVTNELAKRYTKDGVLFFSLHPGAIRTELQERTPNYTQLRRRN